jgi:putative Holliday junction resolvase
VGRILGVDYGRRRIGVSISDPLGLTAQPLDTWKGFNREKVLKEIRTLVEQLGVERVVVGFPLTLKGEEGTMAKEVKRFAAELECQIRVPVTLWDERLTSVEAQRILHRMGEKPSRKKEKIDLIAAVLLLENYLEYRKMASREHRGEEC